MDREHGSRRPAGATAWQQAVPDAVGEGGQVQALLLVLACAVEEAELDGFGVWCGEGEVHAGG
jgi:hypothetical protein